jgi:ribosomal-protein-alanine N-acetyltransferase
MSVEESPLVLYTERLVLHVAGADAAARVVSYFEQNRAHLAPWEPPFPQGIFTSAFWARRLELAQREYRDGSSMRLVLSSRAEPEGPIVGMANFTQFVRGAFMCCTLGYSLAHDVQGAGMMSEALRAAIHHVFHTLGMHRIQANYIPGNERSGQLLRRLGFAVEGYARDYLFINGQWRDHILTSLSNTQASLPDYLQEGMRLRA